MQMQLPYSKQSTDAQLVAGCCQQHRLAQQHLYRRYYGQLLGVCMRYTAHRDEAEAILNQAFLKNFPKNRRVRRAGFFERLDGHHHFTDGH